MTHPVRIKLSRKSGFKLQQESLKINGLPAVSVARGANRKWENPFIIGEYVTKAFNKSQKNCLVRDKEDAARSFELMLLTKDRNYPSKEDIFKHLKGKNLACWCDLGEPCHADKLLEFIAKWERENG